MEFIPEKEPADRQAEPDLQGARNIDSGEIFRGEKSVVITHDGVPYRLLITRNNKLILHK